MPAVPDLNLFIKRKKNLEQKQLVAKKAARLIQPGETIGLNTGSTVEYILDYLVDKTPLTIVTLNIHIAAKALLIDGVDVLIPGGKLYSNSGAVTGPSATEFIDSLVLDRCFIGISAVNLKNGICHPNLEEVQENRAMINASTKKYIITDSTKFDQTAPYKMIGFDEIDSIIVDDNFPEKYREYMELHEIEVI